ncbi:MAG: hypothetical protein H6741_23895 [Alphaproteobacteria bacterium]|nr:hypothetical protein [Alphaproteobacteria bacterium]
MSTAHAHELACPLCARSYTVATEHDVRPQALPCGPCWRVMGPIEKAPWVRRMRAIEAPRRSLTHRDPVVYAPATLKAYVENLEVALAAKEAMLRDRARRLEALEQRIQELESSTSSDSRKPDARAASAA